MPGSAPPLHIWSDDETVGFGFDDEAEPLVVSWRWIRDNSRDATSFDASTRQRIVDTFTLDPRQPAGDVTIDGDHVRVSWPDDTADSLLPITLLREVSGRGPGVDYALWHTAEAAEMSPLPYDAVVRSEDGRAEWLHDISRFGVGLISGAPPETSSVNALVARIGYVRQTIFGGTWTLAAGLTEHADSAYNTDTLEPHTDGTYSHDAPGLQLFVCAERTGDGGESVIVDGFAAADHLRVHDPSAFHTLTTVPVPAHYIEHGVHLRAQRPTIRLDDMGNLLQITFNNYDRAPFALAPGDMDEWYRAYGAFHELIADRSRWWSTYLTPGDALIIDNWRCLHGRMAFTGTRVFHGCYLNHEDFEGAIRVNATAIGTM